MNEVKSTPPVGSAESHQATALAARAWAVDVAADKMRHLSVKTNDLLARCDAGIPPASIAHLIEDVRKEMRHIYRLTTIARDENRILIGDPNDIELAREFGG